MRSEASSGISRAQLESILCCPDCRGRLEFSAQGATCPACAERFPYLEGKYYFRKAEAASGIGRDSLYHLKQWLKRFPGLYRFAFALVSPVYMRKGPLARAIGEDVPVKVNLGSGETQLSPEMINVDVFPYPSVHIVADIQRLPFRDDSVSLVCNVAVLEHVVSPERVAAEAYRVLHPGGKVFCIWPFLQPFHAAPHDYNRVTLPGLRIQHQQFREIAAGVQGGPASAVLWMLQDSVATLLSFGSPRLKSLLYLLLTAVTFPLKYLDIILTYLPTAQDVASSFYFYGEKQ